MIIAVTWQYTILTLGSASTGYRVARRQAAGYVPPVFQSGIDTPSATPSQFSSGGDAWHRNAPPVIHYPVGLPFPNGFDYSLAFWTVSGHDLMSANSSFAQVVESPNANETFGGPSAWALTANAFYVRNFDEGGPGDEALFVDMFDITSGAFIAPDFVDVTPDPTGALTVAGNNGYIDTSTQIAAGANNRITVAARDQVINWKFDHWFSVAACQHAHDPANPPLVGQPGPHDLVVGQSDDLYAFAMYTKLPPSPPPRVPVDYDPWWWFKTHGGLVPPGPGPQWREQYIAALALADAAGAASPQLRAEILELTLRQISLASTALKKDIAGRLKLKK